MQLIVLGTHSPYALPNHNGPGYLIRSKNSTIMLDCGSGTHTNLEFPVDLNNLHIFLSHLHSDHFSDIFNIQNAAYVFHNQKRLMNKINIYMPSTPCDKFNFITTEEFQFCSYNIINENSKITIEDIEISFLRVDHPVEAYAIKLKDNNSTLIYTGDTSFSSKDKLVKFSKNADMLISEASLLLKHGFPKINSHLTAYQAATIAKEANVKLLGLTHFWPEENPLLYLYEAKSVFENTVILDNNYSHEF